VAHLNLSHDGVTEIQTATMDIGEYLKQAGQTAGHRELWRLLRTLFKEDGVLDESIGQGQGPPLGNILAQIYRRRSQLHLQRSAGGNGGDIVNTLTLGVKDIPCVGTRKT
jgi:hypothetical protein